jgi:hypothetical protein
LLLPKLVSSVLVTPLRVLANQCSICVRKLVPLQIGHVRIKAPGKRVRPLMGLFFDKTRLQFFARAWHIQ